MPHNTTTDDQPTTTTNPHDLTSLPPFPNTLPSAPITHISLTSMLASSPTALSALTTASTTHGFFYLSLSPSCPLGSTLLSSSAALLDLSHRAFALPQDEKLLCAHGGPNTRSLFGFKRAGIVAATDPFKRPDRGEMWNLSKDDVLLQTKPPARPVSYPDVIQREREELARFMRAAHDVGMRVLDCLADAWGVDRGVLRAKHRLQDASGDHVRLTWGPGNRSADADADAAKEGGKDTAATQITTFAHTDFGSVTLLFNWLGGLQIELPSESADTSETNGDMPEKQWYYIPPLPNHCIINLGDSAVQFSGGRVKSGRHRVVKAPGEQGRCERYSVVYFVRPGDDVVLENLVDGDGEEGDGGEKKWTAKEWIEEKARGLGNKIVSGD